MSLLVVIMAPALLMAAGLVLDGGRQLQARRDAGGPRQRRRPAPPRSSPKEIYGAGSTPVCLHGRAPSSAAQGAAGSVSIDGQTSLSRSRAGVDYLILPGGRIVSTSSTPTPLDGRARWCAP